MGEVIAKITPEKIAWLQALRHLAKQAREIGDIDTETANAHAFTILKICARDANLQTEGEEDFKTHLLVLVESVIAELEENGGKAGEKIAKALKDSRSKK
ncbi:hypothetical protein K2X83_01740 [Patescibacteria group bacterium]|nr:hypothetical protein [Patescibacteria group bacterium]